MNPSSAATRFQALIADFATALQLPFDRETEMLAIAAGEMQALIRPHPLDPARIAMVVEVLSLGSDEALAALPAASAMLLHRLNHRAWTEHGWQILIDDQNMLGLRDSRPLAEMTREALEDWIVEGLERGQTLTSLWREANEGLAPAAPLEMPDWRSQLSGMIRG
jgi:hypothetical protein